MATAAEVKRILFEVSGVNFSCFPSQDIDAASMAISSLVNHHLYHPPDPDHPGRRLMDQLVVHIENVSDEDIAYLTLSYVTRLENLLRQKFPFQRISTPLAEEILSIPTFVENASGEVVLNRLLSKHLRDDSFRSDRSYIRQMQEFIDHLDGSILVEALWQNHLECTSKNIPFAAYRFLVLLELVFHKNLELPPFEDFLREKEAFCNHPRFHVEYDYHMDRPPFSNNWTAKVIDKSARLCLNDPELPIPNARFIDVVSSSTSTPNHYFLNVFLNNNNRLRRSLECAQNTSFDVWQDKGIVLVRLFSSIFFDLSNLLQALLDSPDPKTRRIGENIEHALDPKTKPIDRANCIYQTLECLPMDRSDFPSIFRRNFLAGPMETDSMNGYILPLSNSKYVFASRNHLFGLYSSVSYLSLFAFSKETKKLTWEVLLTELHPTYKAKKELLQLQLTPLGIIIMYGDNKTVVFIDPDTGMIHHKIRLPVDPEKDAKIHVTPTGFLYYFTTSNNQKTLFGGKPENGEWKTAFQKAIDCTTIYPLEEFVYSLDPSTKMQFVVDREGNLHPLKNSCQAIAKSGKLYTVDTSFEGDQKPFVVQRKLKGDGSFLFFEEGRVSIPDPKSTLLRVFDDGTCVCVTSKNTLVFADVKTEEFIESPKVISGSIFVDEKKGAVWNEENRELWRHSKEESRYVQKLKHIHKLVYVDEKDHCYYIKRF